MSRQKSYAPRFEEITAFLEAREDPVLRLDEVRKLFRKSRSGAYELMRQAGGQQGFVGVDDLLRHLENEREKLLVAAAEDRLRAYKLRPLQPLAILSRLADVPEVTIANGVMRVTAWDQDESPAAALLSILQRFLYAASNDMPLLQELCSPKERNGTQ